MNLLSNPRNFFIYAALLTFCCPALLSAHEGEPVEPTITEDSPREYSQLYLERKNHPWTPLEDGIRYQELRTGSGPSPYKGAIVYIMWRMFDQKDGKEIFYRTKHRTDHFFYDSADGAAMGGGGMLHAVEQALRDMHEGGKRIVAVSANKAFGPEGWSDSHFMVPPNMDVVLELSLLWVRDPNPKRLSAAYPHARPGEVPAAREEKDPGTTATISAASPR